MTQLRAAARLSVTRLEDRTTPTVNVLTAVGAGPGGGPRVQVIDAFAANSERSFLAFEDTFTGGVNVATGDVTGDGHPDFVVAARVGGGPIVKVFDGATGSEVNSFFAFAPDFRGGVSVALGDVTGDGNLDIIAAAGTGGTAHVRVFDGQTGAEVKSFFAYDSSFLGGAVVAAGDVNGDTIADIITAAGAGGGPNVKVFDGKTGEVIRSFFAFDSGFTGGVSVAAGDTNGDGRAEVFASPARTGGPIVKQFDDQSGAEVASFFAFGSDFLEGLSLNVATDSTTGASRLVVSPLSPVRTVRVFLFSGTGRAIANGTDVGGSAWGGSEDDFSVQAEIIRQAAQERAAQAAASKAAADAILAACGCAVA